MGLRVRVREWVSSCRSYRIVVFYILPVLKTDLYHLFRVEVSIICNCVSFFVYNFVSLSPLIPSEGMSLRCQKELVLLYRQDSQRPARTADWLNARGYVLSHHHIRCPGYVFRGK